MRLIDASYKILHNPVQIGEDFWAGDIHRLERIARVCYKSEDKITEDSAQDFLAKLIAHGHEAMIEHAYLTVLFTVDRGVSHELVRHRMASFAQESTRYCNYSQEKFGQELTFIRPYWFNGNGESEAYAAWYSAMEACEKSYFKLIRWGQTPQEARQVLPNSLKTDIVITANYREWRHIFRLRTAMNAHPQMREVMCPLFNELREQMPFIFGKPDWTKEGTDVGGNA